MLNTRNFRCALVSATILAAAQLGGCVSVLPEAQPPSFLVRAPDVSPNVVGTLETRVVINTPESTGALSGAEIAATRDGGLIYINGVRWADSPSAMLQSGLIDVLSQADGDGWVATVKSGARGDFELRWTIRDLSFNMDESVGVCDVRLTLMSAARRNVIATERIRMTVQSDKKSDEARAANAVAMALTRAAERTAEFVLTHATLDNRPERTKPRPESERRGDVVPEPMPEEDALIGSEDQA